MESHMQTVSVIYLCLCSCACHLTGPAFWRSLWHKIAVTVNWLMQKECSKGSGNHRSGQSHAPKTPVQVGVEVLISFCPQLNSLSPPSTTTSCLSLFYSKSLYFVFCFFVFVIFTFVQMLTNQSGCLAPTQYIFNWKWFLLEHQFSQIIIVIT